MQALYHGAMNRIIRAITPPIFFGVARRISLIVSKRRNIRQNIRALSKFDTKFKLLDFMYIDTLMMYDLKWGWWSRVYEYEFVLNTLKDLGCTTRSNLHNTCWGWHGTHILFKNELESRYPNIVNSDLRASRLENTTVYDVTSSCPPEWVGKFDFVINVSTVEEINNSHVEVIENLLKMVKVGGFLIATFDYPGIQLEMIEKLFDKKIHLTPNAVNGSTSAYPMDEYKDLNVGYFILQRI